MCALYVLYWCAYVLNALYVLHMCELNALYVLHMYLNGDCVCAECAVCAVLRNIQVAAAVRLLAKGADRHLRDNEGRTAMDWANRFGSTRLLDVLLFDPNKVPAPPAAASTALLSLQVVFTRNVGCR